MPGKLDSEISCSAWCASLSSETITDATLHGASGYFGAIAPAGGVQVTLNDLSGNDKPTGGYRDVFFSNTTPDGVNNSGTFFPWRYSASYPRLEQFGVTWRMKF